MVGVNPPCHIFRHRHHIPLYDLCKPHKALRLEVISHPAIHTPWGTIRDERNSIREVVIDVCTPYTIEYDMVFRDVLLCGKHLKHLGILPRSRVGEYSYVRYMKSVPREGKEVIRARIGKVGSNPIIIVDARVIEEHLIGIHRWDWGGNLLLHRNIPITLKQLLGTTASRYGNRARITAITSESSLVLTHLSKVESE